MSMREREPNAKRIFRKAQARGLALAVLILLLACGSHPGNGPITTRGGGPTDIVLGPDGNLWFTEGTGTSARAKVFLGRITIRGTITEFPLPSGVVLNTIAAAADGTLWFTEFTAGKIGRIRPDGTIVEFTLPANPDDPSFVDMPMDVAAGPGDTLWVSLLTRQGAKIGRVTPDGAVPSEYPLHIYGMVHLVAGPDGNLWFTNHDANLFGRMTPTGAVTTFKLPVERVDLRMPNP